MKIKFIVLFFLLGILLVGCSNELKVGDQFVLVDTVSGGHSINDYKEATEAIISMGEDFDPSTMGHLIDISNIEVIFEGEEVQIIKVSEEYNMFQLQHIDPNTGQEIEIWVTKEDLNEAR